MATTASYSLWLQPAEGPLRDALSRELNLLADAHPGAPHFLPHVTLLGSIEGKPEVEVLRTAQELASQLSPYDITFERVAKGTFFYQTVFLLAEKTSETMEAAALARKLFEVDATGPYMPHLSLLYADITDDKKDEVTKASQERFWGPGGTWEALGTGPRLPVRSISVWLTPTDDKTTQSWRLVAEYPLQA